nr:MAG TPA: hypothetical protein [Caudoviricetes sp.]
MITECHNYSALLHCAQVHFMDSPSFIQNHNLPKIFLSIPDRSTFEDAYGPF